MPKLIPWDLARSFENDGDVGAYLKSCAEANDPPSMVIALGNVARGGNMSALARQVGMTREGLYKALSVSGNPSFTTISKVATALGYPLVFDVASLPAAGVVAGASAADAEATDVADRAGRSDVQRRALALIDATVTSATQLRESVLELAGAGSVTVSGDESPRIGSGRAAVGKRANRGTAPDDV